MDLLTAIYTKSAAPIVSDEGCEGVLKFPSLGDRGLDEVLEITQGTVATAAD